MRLMIHGGVGRWVGQRSAVVVTLAVVFATGIVSSIASAQAPSIELSSDRWAFGEIEEGDKREHRVSVTNRGTAALTIQRVDPGCGCIDASVKVKTLAPGVTTDLDILLRASLDGEMISKTIKVYSDDPKTPVARVQVSGFVRRRWWLEPRHLQLGSISDDRDTFGAFSIVVRPGLDLEFEGITTEAKGVTFKATPFGDVDGLHGLRVTFTVEKGQPAGRLAIPIRIAMKDRYKAFVLSTIRGRVLGAIDLRPNQLGFGRLFVGRAKRLVLKMDFRKRGEIRVTRIECADPQIKVKKRIVIPGRSYEFDVVCTPTKKDRVAGDLMIHIEGAIERVVKVPYYGIVIR